MATEMTGSMAVVTSGSPKSDLTRGDSILDSLIGDPETSKKFTQGPLFKVGTITCANGGGGL